MIGCGTTGSGMIGVGGSPGRGSRNGGGTSGPGSVAVLGGGVCMAFMRTGYPAVDTE
jgi:hypothetical protein